MWVRKSAEIISVEAAEKEQSVRSFSTPLKIAAVSTAAAAILFSLGVRVGGGGIFHLKPPGTEYIRQNPWSLGLVFVIVFVWTYLKQRTTGESELMPSTNALLCPRCFEAHPPGTDLCPCGGQPEPLSHWEWRDEEEEAREAAR